jgi:hypothetical protein
MKKTEKNSDNDKKKYPSSLRESKIKIFYSFEEQEAYERKKMADLSPDESIEKLEYMRKFFFKEAQNPDGSWKSLERKISIHKPKSL